MESAVGEVRQLGWVVRLIDDPVFLDRDFLTSGLGPRQKANWGLGVGQEPHG